MKKRKHRLVLDVTVSKPITRRDAAKGVRNILSTLDLGAKPMWHYEGAPYVDVLVVKEPRPNGSSLAAVEKALADLDSYTATTPQEMSLFRESVRRARRLLYELRSWAML